MSQVSYGMITITDTTDLTTYIRYAKQAPLTAASQFQETPTTETHYIAVLNIPSSDTIPAWNSTDWKWSEFIGTDGVSVLGTREIYYLKTNSTTVTAPANGSDISQASANVENQWTKSVPTYITNGEYWTCIQTHLDGSPTWVYGSPVLNQSLTDMNHDIDVIKSVTQQSAEDAQGAMSQAAATQVAQEALASKLKRIWINEVTSGNYLAGTYAASGINGVTFSESNPSSYGFNSLLRHNYLSFRYNTYKLVTIGTGVAVDSDSAISGVAINVPILTNNVISGIAKGMELSSGALKFYHAPTISGSTVIDGSLAMELTGNALNFYGSSTSTTDAILNSNGLTLSKGGIKVIPSGGAIGDNNSVYISSDNLGSVVSSLVPTPSGGTAKTNWRAVIGSKFGVDSEGNLYANNAYITGEIKADTGRIGGTSGWTIASQQIYSTDETIGTDNSMFLSTKNLAGTVAGTTLTTTAPSWRLTVGSNFGVDNTGKLYASGADISGAVHMESGIIDYGVIIGQADSVHISLSQEQISFWRGSEDNDINKTAYITNQYMYIPYTVVLNEMQVGTKPKYKEIENPSDSNPFEQGWYEIIDGEYILTTDTTIVSGKTYYEIDGDVPLWSWRKMDSGNLRLMWLGGEV